MVSFYNLSAERGYFMTALSKRRQRNISLTDWLVGILAGFLTYTFSFLLVVNLRPIYSLCIRLFNLSSVLSLSDSTLTKYFGQMSNYLLPFSSADNLNGIPLSQTSTAALADYKVLILIMYIVFILLLGAFVALVCLRSRKTGDFWLTSSVCGLLFPIIVSAVFILFYPNLLNTIHSFIFGHNVVDESVSTIFNLLTYDCILMYAAVISIISIIVGVVFAVIFINTKKIKDDEYKIPQKQNYFYI